MVYLYCPKQPSSGHTEPYNPKPLGSRHTKPSYPKTRMVQHFSMKQGQTGWFRPKGSQRFRHHSTLNHWGRQRRFPKPSLPLPIFEGEKKREFLQISAQFHPKFGKRPTPLPSPSFFSFFITKNWPKIRKMRGIMPTSLILAWFMIYYRSIDDLCYATKIIIFCLVYEFLDKTIMD